MCEAAAICKNKEIDTAIFGQKAACEVPEDALDAAGRATDVCKACGHVCGTKNSDFWAQAA